MVRKIHSFIRSAYCNVRNTRQVWSNIHRIPHEKIRKLTQTLKDKKFEGYIEADGGVTLDNVGACFTDGARAFVGGNAIIGQNDVRVVIREFRNRILRSRRKLLIKKANELGGTDLVNKWIDLHVVGKKKDELLQISQELGYQ